jgi:hypothetical protein
LSGSSERIGKGCPLSRPPINLSVVALRLWAWRTSPRRPQGPGFPDFFRCRTLGALSCRDPECDLWVVSGEGEAEFKVTITWEKTAEEKKAGPQGRPNNLA